VHRVIGFWGGNAGAGQHVQSEAMSRAPWTNQVTFITATVNKLSIRNSGHNRHAQDRQRAERL